MPNVSIIIPTHNRPHVLPRAVESARYAGKDVEIIVVDDASVDRTADVCQSLKDIRYIRLDRNQGVAGARNIGILASLSEFICFLDDDDVRLPDSLDPQLDILRRSPEAGMVYGQMFIGDENCRPTGPTRPETLPEGDIFWRLLGGNFVPCLATLFRKSCLNRIGLLDATIPGLDDWDLWIRLSELYPVLALAQPVAVWCRPQTPDYSQQSANTPHVIWLAERLVRERWLSLGAG